jgi:hypothetical protein
MMALWNEYEEHLAELAVPGTSFSVHEIAAHAGVPVSRASAWIQAYQAAKNARWEYGARAADARKVGVQFTDDMRRRVYREIDPTLRRIGVENPRALPAAEGVMKIIDGGLDLIAGMLDGKDGS